MSEDVAETIVQTTQASGLSLEAAHSLTSSTITLMGASFILGVLFMTFMLLVLDFMRRNQPDE